MSVLSKAKRRYVRAGMRKPRTIETTRNYTQADGIGYDIEKEFPRLCIRHCKDGETLPISSLNLWNCYRSFMAFKTITSSLSNI